MELSKEQRAKARTFFTEILLPPNVDRFIRMAAHGNTDAANLQRLACELLGYSEGEEEPIPDPFILESGTMLDEAHLTPLGKSLARTGDEYPVLL